MPSITVTTCGRCGRTHDPKWRAGVRYMVTRLDRGAEKSLFNVDDACRLCSEAFEKRVKDFAAAFTTERKPREKKAPGEVAPVADDHGDHPDRDEPASVAS